MNLNKLVTNCMYTSKFNGLSPQQKEQYSNIDYRSRMKLVVCVIIKITKKDSFYAGSVPNRWRFDVRLPLALSRREDVNNLVNAPHMNCKYWLGWRSGAAALHDGSGAEPSRFTFNPLWSQTSFRSFVIPLLFQTRTDELPLPPPSSLHYPSRQITSLGRFLAHCLFIN